MNDGFEVDTDRLGLARVRSPRIADHLSHRPLDSVDVAGQPIAFVGVAEALRVKAQRS